MQRSVRWGGLDEDRARLYADLVIASLGKAAWAALEELMQSGSYEYQSDFAKKYVAQGRQKGEAEALLEVLDARGLAVTAEARERILTCADVDQLKTWLRRAVTADSLDAVFGGKPKKPAKRAPSVKRRRRSRG